MGHGGDLRFQVENLTRVEGEGSLHLRVRDGVVEEAHLEIFEAPRYFEALVVGRTPNEVIDIVARICGICPVAYQMSAVHAFEDLFGVEVDPQVRALRRLLYCAEWIESHALHIYLLHAPDFLGYPSAVELARDHRELVADGLRLKKAGNHLLATLGGRPIHPVSVRVGGFSRMPSRSELLALRPSLAEALALSLATVDVAVGLDAPEFEREPRLVSLRHPTEYPLNDGRIVSSDGVDLAPPCRAPDAAGSCPNCFSHDDPNDPARAAGPGPNAWWNNSSCRDACHIKGASGSNREGRRRKKGGIMKVSKRRR